MSVWEVVLIGVALSMDAFAITIANCATYKDTLNRKKEWAMPVAFAIFQILMPIIGYYIGSLFAEYISSAAKYVTAAIFFVLAAKIVIDNIKEARKEETEEKTAGNFTLGIIALQAVATSIDALAVGVTFAVELEFSVFVAAGIIGAVTFTLVTAALFIGKFLGALLGKYAQWTGAFILFFLAVKNFIEGIIGIIG